MRGMRALLIVSGVAQVFLLSACAHHPIPEQIHKSATTQRIHDGFLELGASEKKSACFADVLATRLDDGAGDKAATVIETAQSKKEMRSGVMAADREIRRAFIAANMRCSFAG